MSDCSMFLHLCQLRGVDVMVGGDRHTLLGDTDKLSVVPGSVPAGAYPTEVTNLDGKTVCVVQAWHYAHAVGKLSVSFDANGDVTSCSGGPVFPVADSSTYVTTPPWGQTGNPLSAEDQALVVAKLEQNHAKVTAEHADTKAWIDTNKGEITTMQVGRPIIFGKYRLSATLTQIAFLAERKNCDLWSELLPGSVPCLPELGDLLRMRILPVWRARMLLGGERLPDD